MAGLASHQTRHPVWIALCLFIILFSGAGIVPSALAQAQETWQVPVNLSESLTPSLWPDITVDRAGHVYVVWEEVVGSVDGGNPSTSILIRVWDGQAWSPANDVAMGGHQPRIAVDSQGRLHLIRLGDNEHGGLLYSRAWAQGNPGDARSWTPAHDLALQGAGAADVVVDGQDRVHVVFQGLLQGSETRLVQDDLCVTGCAGIFYLRSSDGGDTWSEPVQLDAPDTDALNPHLAVDGQGNPHVIWTDTNVQGQPLTVEFSHSPDGGLNWSDPAGNRLSPDGVDEPGTQACQIVPSSMDVVFVIRNQAGLAIGYGVPPDQGAYRVPTEVVRQEGVSSCAVALAMDSADTLHVLFPLEEDKKAELPAGIAHLSRSSAGDWAQPNRISRSPCNVAPIAAEMIAGGGNHLYAVWVDLLDCDRPLAATRGQGEVFCSEFVSDAPPAALSSLPPMLTPTPTHVISTTHAAPTPGLTASPLRTPSSSTDLPAQVEVDGTESSPDPLLLGIGLTVIVLLAVTVWRWTLIGWLEGR